MTRGTDLDRALLRHIHTKIDILIFIYLADCSKWHCNTSSSSPVPTSVTCCKAHSCHRRLLFVTMMGLFLLAAVLVLGPVQQAVLAAVVETPLPYGKLRHLQAPLGNSTTAALPWQPLQTDACRLADLTFSFFHPHPLHTHTHRVHRPAVPTRCHHH